jgi:hypothetical protein
MYLIFFGVPSVPTPRQEDKVLKGKTVCQQQEGKELSAEGNGGITQP